MRTVTKIKSYCLWNSLIMNLSLEPIFTISVAVSEIFFSLYLIFILYRGSRWMVPIVEYSKNDITLSLVNNLNYRTVTF